MWQRWRFSWWWVVAGALIALAGATAIARQSLEQQRALFETDARIVHRLLSQQVVQHDAILATLALLQPSHSGPGALGRGSPEQRLPALYPRILSVQRSDASAPWPDPALAEAERLSRQSGRAALAPLDLSSGRYRLVLASDPASFALTIDLQALVPWTEWPMAADTSNVRVEVVHAGQRHVIQQGKLHMGAGSRFGFHKVVAADSQPFDVVATQTVGWQQWPWVRMLVWTLAVAALLAAVRHLQRQRLARQRAEELLRLGQVARLNTLGELAAGMAHELNQPLTALLANTQAAQRLLDDDPPELATARNAMAQAAAQARRAADVVGRLRRAVERPDTGGQRQSVDAVAAVRRALDLLEPEYQKHGVLPTLDGKPVLGVMADPVALDQIVHNLIVNALQALEHVPAAQRRLRLTLRSTDGLGELSVVDSGLGIPAHVLPRVFEPFFSTREGGLGLGLSLCETLASGMGGSLSAGNVTSGGAVFRLRLPLAMVST